MKRDEAALILLGKRSYITPEVWQEASKCNKPRSEKQIAKAIYFDLFRFTAWFYLLLPWMNLPRKVWREVKLAWKECKVWREVKLAWKECKESYSIYHSPGNMADLLQTVKKDNGRKITRQYQNPSNYN